MLANGCKETKSGHFKGVWIRSVPTAYLSYGFTEFRHFNLQLIEQYQQYFSSRRRRGEGHSHVNAPRLDSAFLQQ